MKETNVEQSFRETGVLNLGSTSVYFFACAGDVTLCQIVSPTKHVSSYTRRKTLATNNFPLQGVMLMHNKGLIGFSPISSWVEILYVAPQKHEKSF